MLIDTHCHLDAAEFDADRAAVVARARSAGVRAVVVPAIGVRNFAGVREAAAGLPGGCYALGIHPLEVPRARDEDLERLEAAVARALDDPRFVAIGEIGLDFFMPESRDAGVRERQERFYAAQLALARRHGLPVLLHVRRAQDAVLKQLRRLPVAGGIAHAFNGSEQQARQFMDQGCALGVGGAMTYAQALQIRRLAATLPLSSLVLETDAPDIPPAWLGGPGQPPARNEPAEVAGVAEALARLRDVPLATVLAETAATARRVLPRLGAARRRGATGQS